MGLRAWTTWLIIFSIRYSILIRVCHYKHKRPTDNPPIQIHVNKTDNRITFKIRLGCSFELLTTETMKLHGNKEYKNDKSVSQLEITEVILVHCNLANNTYQHDSRVSHTFILNTYQILGRHSIMPTMKF